MSYPIVLAHGVCRFDNVYCDALQIDNTSDEKLDQLHYFKGLRTFLIKKGFTVYHSSVSWAEGVKIRAEELGENVIGILEKEGSEKVNIIAHSMGGLDARHMLFDFRNSDRLHEKVASLTTISTPHWGSSFADWGTDNLPHVIPMAQKVGLCLNGLSDLRTDKCSLFNNDPEVMEFEKFCEDKILFQTFAGKQDYLGVFDPLKLPFYIIEKREGENDGLVSVKSAKWKNRFFKGFFENADHLNELGWWDTCQIFELEFKEQLLKRIHDIYQKIAEDLP